MAAGLRKCLDLVALADGGSQGNLQHPDTRQRVIESGAKWVRVWILWDKAQPTSSTYDAGYLGLIDEQIRIAVNELHIRVVLVTTRFPQWANGTQGADPNTYAAQDRPKPTGGLKELVYGIPTTQLGTNQAWGSWMNFLIGRYKGWGWNVILEIMNEPNYELWPQKDSSGNTIIWNKVAEMMNTAAAVSGWHANALPIAAPAASDTRLASNRAATNHGEFAFGLKTALQNMNQRGMPTFLWTWHNYADIRMSEIVSARNTRRLLVNFWLGWSPSGNFNGSDPGVLITEGGSRHDQVGPAVQAQRMQTAWNLAVPEPGIAMLTNYELWAVGGYDTALREARAAGGAARPVWNTFTSWPGN
jgi:hypothetical protein